MWQTQCSRTSEKHYIAIMLLPIIYKYYWQYYIQLGNDSFRPPPHLHTSGRCTVHPVLRGFVHVL
ncbi:hypothetical protein M405DRAFT_104979 [Rhizopogon salebrosus TDB-379]|nr:hypothetical protein M405DRAFT_104979 [Rhizopogon salebrosus TDB-379]